MTMNKKIPNEKITSIGEAKKLPKETRLQRYDRLTSPKKVEDKKIGTLENIL